MQPSAKVALSSILSTARANLSVGPPYDIATYRNGSLELQELRLDEHSEYLGALHHVWVEHLLQVVDILPAMPSAE